MKMKLPVVNEADVAGKNVMVRADLDVELGLGLAEIPRIAAAAEIGNWLLENKAAKVKIMGHGGKGIIASWLERSFKGPVEIDDNLRADPREEENDGGFATNLIEGWDIYVNEAFATSHRKHASIVMAPRLMRDRGNPVYAGMRFVKEVGMLEEVWKKPGKKMLIIGGAKAADKAPVAEKLAQKFDFMLKGGLMPGVSLRPDGLDLSDEAIEAYVEAISQADVIVVAGPLGKFEEEDSERGTKTVYTAVANSKAYKVAGGGDTEAALRKFELKDKFDWISVGGGSMLQLLADGTLPGIEALIG
jgi:phosphoglycerate kinase